MKINNVYLNLNKGSRQKGHIRIKERCEGGIHAVFIDGFTNCGFYTPDGTIDPDFGAGIDLEIEHVKSWMADYRYCEFWCRPEFGTKLGNIPEETQGLIYEKTDGTFGVILPVVSEQYKCVLEGTEEQIVTAKLLSGCEGLVSCKALAFIWAEGENPYTLLEKCTEYALKLLETGYRTRKERRYPEMFEYLGWCSWDAFEIRVSEENLLEKCREFADKEIPVKWAIIDDMWAEVRDFYGMEYQNREEMFDLVHSSKLYSFRADPIRFPNGLKGCIDKIKEYGIKVGMWHPTTGYWMGIDPEGEIFKEYKDCLIQAQSGQYVPSPQLDKSYRFYHGFHNYLRKCGAEFIKIDNQSMSRKYYRNHGPVGQVARQFHDAMEASAGQHFDNQMINCMGMANEDMWNRSVSPIARCSADFLPENKEWFTDHIMQCSYNCLIQGQFYYCDWDMWWTDDGQALKNSIIRAVSGGPIYVSDTLHRSKAEVLQPLIFADGKILRCEEPGMPTRDCLTQNPMHSGKIFKIQNTCNGCGILAVFNLDEEDRRVSGKISALDIEKLKGEDFAVYEHFSKEFRVLQKGESFTLELENRDAYKLYVIVPLKDGNAMIGRTDKFISPASFRYDSAGNAKLLEAGPYAYVENYRLVLKE